MFQRVKILQPMLDGVVQARYRGGKSWPTFDGATLDRASFVTASEIGKCARMVWFGKNVPLTEGKVQWGFFERGHSHEAWIVDQLRSYQGEYRWTYIGGDQVSFHDGHQSGTPDGLLECPNGDLYVVDFKSIDPRKNVAKLPAPEHIDQVLQNTDLVEACLDVEVSGALLAYSDASDYSKVREYLVDATCDEAIARRELLEQRAENILTANSADQVMAEGIYNGGCTFCPFTAQCSAAVEQSNVEKLRNDTAKRTAQGIFGQPQARSS